MPAIHMLKNLGDLPPSPVHLPVFERLLEQRSPHEQDFLFFRNLKSAGGIFFDVGANIGNSALSINLVQPHWRVISFEPNVSLLYFLERAKAKLSAAGADMTIHQVGLGDIEGVLDFYVPKVEDWYVVGEASFDLVHFDNPIVVKRLSSYSKHGYWELAKTSLPVVRFEDFADVRSVLEAVQDDVDVVVKMDVEGFEYHALSGMTRMIESKRAIFMIENSGDPRIDEIFRRNGYDIFDYDPTANKLWRNFASKRGLNSFYIPVERLDADPRIAACL